jgi:hypothetical protein
VEKASGWRRGTLSQVETGKAKPNGTLVEYYDENFDAAGLLLSLFAEAHAVHARVGAVKNYPGERFEPGDDMKVLQLDQPRGSLVTAGAPLRVVCHIVNAGVRGWQGRKLRRVGAVAGTRLIVSAPSVPIPDTAPGDTAEAVIELLAPQEPGSVIAYWRMMHADGHYAFPVSESVSVQLVVP